MSSPLSEATSTVLRSPDARGAGRGTGPRWAGEAPGPGHGATRQTDRHVHTHVHACSHAGHRHAYIHNTHARRIFARAHAHEHIPAPHTHQCTWTCMCTGTRGHACSAPTCSVHARGCTCSQTRSHEYTHVHIRTQTHPHRSMHAHASRVATSYVQVCCCWFQHSKEPCLLVLSKSPSETQHRPLLESLCLGLLASPRHRQVWRRPDGRGAEYLRKVPAPSLRQRERRGSDNGCGSLGRRTGPETRMLCVGFAPARGALRA